MASILKVDKLDPQGGTALEIGTSGDTISIPSGATLDISASTLTPPATMPASSGINLTALNATNLGSGTVPTARLGSGSASSSVFLSGASTWIAAGGGKVVQAVLYTETTTYDTTSTSNIQGPQTGTLTMVDTSNRVFVIASFEGNPRNSGGAGVDGSFGLYRGNIATGTEITTAEDMVHDDVSANVWTPVTLMTLDTPGANTTYSVCLNQESIGTNTRIVGTSVTTHIVLLEIE